MEWKFSMEWQQTRWWSTEKKAATLLGLARAASPLYVYDGSSVEQALAQLKSLSSIQSFFYAIKANPHPDGLSPSLPSLLTGLTPPPEVLRAVYEAGFGFECVSPGEVGHVLSLFPDLCRSLDAPSPSCRLLFTPNFAPRSNSLAPAAASMLMPHQPSQRSMNML